MMPTFHIEMFEGRSVEQKRELAAALTDTTCKVLGVDASSVDIIFHDVKPENWATAGKLWSDPR
ncbi:4-oxalocrotonate tautomerase [Paraburkholderia tropica]|uniref:4-oxalocrotonate tautomerase n=1 Tax=Paraburkholderia tropica TaxID=92647 RepID=UPI002AB042CB|nr:4-oxalocrotonate tautomerase [Paraburkholderia tropica]